MLGLNMILRSQTVLPRQLVLATSALSGAAIGLEAFYTC